MINYIVFDLEATCGEKYQNIRNEIIEIGAVKINQNLEVVDEFCEFVKPVINPILTPFCTNLTSITQQNIEVSDIFPKVCHRFQEWLGEEYLLVSWGGYDKKQFYSDCEFHSIDKTWADKHIDLKTLYSIKKGVRKMGMVAALRLEVILPEGTHHRGIDDAKNIGKIFIKNFSILGL